MFKLMDAIADYMTAVFTIEFWIDVYGGDLLVEVPEAPLALGGDVEVTYAHLDKMMQEYKARLRRDMMVAGITEDKK